MWCMSVKNFSRPMLNTELAHVWKPSCLLLHHNNATNAGWKQLVVNHADIGEKPIKATIEFLELWDIFFLIHIDKGIYCEVGIWPWFSAYILHFIFPTEIIIFKCQYMTDRPTSQKCYSLTRWSYVCGLLSLPLLIVIHSSSMLMEIYDFSAVNT